MVHLASTEGLCKMCPSTAELNRRIRERSFVDPSSRFTFVPNTGLQSWGPCSYTGPCAVTSDTSPDPYSRISRVLRRYKERTHHGQGV